MCAGLLAGLLASAGCGGIGRADSGDATVTVFAAASLTETFQRLAADFERRNPGTRVRLSLAASSGLAQQIVHGAPADVFASAGPEPMRLAAEAGMLDRPARTFARNRLVIAVPRDNPGRVGGLADLRRPGLKVVLCAEQVPCGAAARRALAAAGVAVVPASRERDVKAALTKVRLGEADAALVYRTDALASARQVRAIDFAESGRAVNDYQIAVLREAPRSDLARRFVRLVMSAREVFDRAGFERAGVEQSGHEQTGSQPT